MKAKVSTGVGMLVLSIALAISLTFINMSLREMNTWDLRAMRGAIVEI